MAKPTFLQGAAAPVPMIEQLDRWLWMSGEAHATFRAGDGSVWTCKHYGFVNTWTQLPPAWNGYKGGAA